MGSEYTLARCFVYVRACVCVCVYVRDAIGTRFNEKIKTIIYNNSFGTHHRIMKGPPRC